MSFVKEFKDFAMKGSVVDLAVGVIIGGAFGKIVSSLVADVIMPPLGVVLGGVDFTGLKLVLKEAAGERAAVTLNYGTFIQNLVDFAIIALVIFLMIKLITKLQKAKTETPAAPPAPTTSEKLLTEIRDALVKK